MHVCSQREQFSDGRMGKSGQVPFLLAEQRRRWSLMIFCARATRGLRRMGREPPDHPSCSQNAHDETVLVRCAQ